MPFVAAVSVDSKGHPLYVKLNRVGGFTSKAIGKWAVARLTPGTLERSHNLGCFAAVAGAGCLHLPAVVGDRKPHDL